jgi:hypothetical protein
MGRAVLQVVRSWPPTAAARFDTRLGHVGFVVDNAALGQNFS